eukprot:s526_g25.t2
MQMRQMSIVSLRALHMFSHSCHSCQSCYIPQLRSPGRLGLRWVSTTSDRGSVCFVARTRLGLEPLLLAELRKDFDGDTLIGKNGAEGKSEESAVPRGLVTPEGKEAEGAVEIHGAWSNLYRILRCSLVQSVWLRVGPCFQCKELSDLETAVQEAPWEDFLDLQQLGPLAFFFFLLLRALCDGPIVAWERESRLDAADVRSTVAQLPLHNVEDMPCARLRPHKPQEAKAILEARAEEARGMMLVGSDRSVAAILSLAKIEQHARDRFRKCSDLLQHMQKAKVREVTASPNESSAEATPVSLGHASKPSKESEMFSFSTADGTELGTNLPCEVSLNAATFEDIAPFLSGALVVSRVPSEAHGLGCTARMARLYRRFGHFLAARKETNLFPIVFLMIFFTFDSEIF